MWLGLDKTHIANLSNTFWHWRDGFSTECAVCALHNTHISFIPPLLVRNYGIHLTTNFHLSRSILELTRAKSIRWK